MSEDQRQNDNQQNDDEERRRASRPRLRSTIRSSFPCCSGRFAAWFGYDIVTDAEAYQNYPLFNQGGLALLSVLALYFTWSAIKEKRAERRGIVRLISTAARRTQSPRHSAAIRSPREQDSERSP